MNGSLSRRGLLALIVVLAIAFSASYLVSRPRPGLQHEPLKDIQGIETLRTQFNRDIGQTRLVILVAPT